MICLPLKKTKSLNIKSFNLMFFKPDIIITHVQNGNRSFKFNTEMEVQNKEMEVLNLIRKWKF